MLLPTIKFVFDRHKREAASGTGSIELRISYNGKHKYISTGIKVPKSRWDEKNQAVNGADSAEILEIIDHHRLRTIETAGPVFFRNQPLGSTCTIIYLMYKEYHVEIDKTTAGLLLAAILSDTLMFRSPTCTAVDKKNGEELAAIANSSAKSFKSLVGKEPRIAMLSHSTKGSAKHALVDKMVEATKIAKEKYPQLTVDGEFQFDAAIVPSE